MPRYPRSPLICALIAVAPVAWAASSPWPAPKDLVASVAAAPDEAKAEALLKLSDAAFAKKGFSEAESLRRLRALDLFMAETGLPEELRSWLVANREVSEEFVGLISSYDDRKAVGAILADLWKADAAGFRVHPRLAMAVALVYDKPCPPWFPHGQVSEKALPRKLHAPGEVFAFFKESQEGSRLAQSVDKLAIDELAFVVPVLAPFSELREAQRRRIGRQDMAKLYFSINYDHARLDRREYSWTGGSYSLESIKSAGGICVDQAYYAATTAQAFGIPAFILSGSGADGFHAFVGYLERPGKWKFDVGRYENQKYATGEAINPLTWRALTDHDMSFLEERFRNTPAYATAQLHVEKAREALAAGKLQESAKLLAVAKSTEPRCPEIWETLAELAEKRGDSPAQVQSLYGEAAKTFARFRELEVLWRTRLAESLEKSGKDDVAFDERAAIVRRCVRGRPDLAVALAEEMMAKVAKSGDARQRLKVFARLATQFDEAGTEFVPKIAYPFMADLLKAGLKKEAVQAARTVSQAFRVDKTSQLAEMQRDLEAVAKAGDMRVSKRYRPAPQNSGE